jgi:hypothetical protein
MKRIDRRARRSVGFRAGALLGLRQRPPPREDLTRAGSENAEAPDGHE